MPSPIGHALAGLAIGLVGEPDVPNRSTRSPWPWRFVALAALFAALPDIDLVLPKGAHRGFSHSLLAVAAVFSIATAMTGEVTTRTRLKLGAMLAAAYGSHLVMDWLGADPSTPAGLQILWPFSHVHFMSGWNLFPQTERAFADPAFWQLNLTALVTEIVLMGPVAGVAWVIRRRRRSRGRSSVRDVPPTPFAAATGTDGISGRQTPRAGR